MVMGSCVVGVSILCSCVLGVSILCKLGTLKAMSIEVGSLAYEPAASHERCESHVFLFCAGSVDADGNPGCSLRIVWSPCVHVHI